MTNPDPAPILISFGVIILAGYWLHTLVKWGEATRKREKEWEEAGTVEIIDDAGETVIVERSKKEEANVTTNAA